MELFVIKKLAAALLMPLPLSLLLLLLAGIGFYRDTRRSAWCCFIAAFMLLFLTSTAPLPHSLLRPIEQEYHQIDLSEPVDSIVLLGGGHTSDGTLPLSAQLYSYSAYRAIEALRIYRQNPGATIITSGGAVNDSFSHAEVMHRLLASLGVPQQHLILGNTTARDTREEAQLMAPMLRGKQFALVTSASHMGRAMTLFQQQGLTPIPAPTEHMVRQGPPSPFWRLAPMGRNITKVERWWYETMGRTWVALRSLFG